MSVQCALCGIRAPSVCGALDDGELGNFSASAVSRQFAAGDTVFFEGDPADNLYNLVSGCVRLSKLLPDGRRQVTGFLFPGNFLGLAYVNSYAFTAEAITNVSVCQFSRGRFQRNLGDFPALEKRLLAMASNELAAAQDQILLLGRKSAKEKVVSFLLNLMRQRSNEDANTVALPMTRNDIADYIGLTTETVSRTISRLTDEGLIALRTPHEVVLVDLEKLRDVAGD